MITLQLNTGDLYLAAAFGIAILAELWYRISLHLPQLVPLGTVSGHKCHPRRGKEDQQRGVHVAVATAILTSRQLCGQYFYPADVSTNQSINAATDLPLRDILVWWPQHLPVNHKGRPLYPQYDWLKWPWNDLSIFLHTMETGLFWHLRHDILAFNLGCCNLHPLHCRFLGVQKVPIQSNHIGKYSMKSALIWCFELISWPRVSKDMTTLG